MKSFITRQQDNVRLAYRRNTQVLPRMCIFVGTANDEDVLPNDPTGNRRFVAIPIPGKHDDIAIGVWMEAHREQLWAEGMSMFMEGQSARIPQALWGEQRERNASHRRADETVEGSIRELGDLRDVSMRDIRAQAQIDRAISDIRIGSALKQLGWTLRKTSGKRLWSAPADWPSTEAQI